jgi:two-component system, NtrC family, sensor histidine kinase HydH
VSEHSRSSQRRGDSEDHLIPDSPNEAAARVAASSHGAASPASEEFSQHLGTLAHELRGLLDGSLRFLSLARGGMERHDPESVLAQSMMQQIDEARDGLRRMERLLERSLRPHSSVTSMCEDSDEPLVEALLHAADSMRVIADDRSIRLSVECSPRLVLTPAGPVYTILVNAIRNAIEAIGINGTIDIIAELATKDPRQPMVCLDIFDDGPGPRRGAEQHLFEFGFSTRVHGDGIGLALIRELVGQHNGTVTMERRVSDRPGWSADRPGAHLSIRIPATMPLLS